MNTAESPDVASPPPSAPPEPFVVRDCALVSIATGVSAQNLREFRDDLATITPGSIYHHFWGRLLQPRFDEPEYLNDFASWAFHALHDKVLAERLSVVNPVEHPGIEELRQETLDVVEQHLDEREHVPWARADQQFHFLRSQIVIFDTGRRVARPEDLVELLPRLSAGSVFYHFIDARRRTPEHLDDLSAWLAGYGSTYGDLRTRLVAVDPYFGSLQDLRRSLAELFARRFGGGGR